MLTRLAVGLLIVIPGCGGGGGGGAVGGGGTGGGGQPDRDWGPSPPEWRGPGAPPTTHDYQPTVLVRNAGLARTETVRASVPFPWGEASSLADRVVAGHETSWLVLQRWPDQSIRVAQAQWTAEFAALEQRAFVVEAGIASTAPFVRHPALAAEPVEFGAEVRDTFGVAYRAHWQGGETVQETSHCRVQKARLYHLAPAGQGIGRDYLTSTFYVTEWRDASYVLVDWLVGNDYLGADAPNGRQDPNLHPLGGIDVRSASFLHRGADHWRAYRASHEAIEGGVLGGDGFYAHRVLADTFLGDGQMRRYRFLLHRDDDALSAADRASRRQSADAAIDEPLRPLARREDWRASCAMSLLGGGAAPPADAEFRIGVELHEWNIEPHFGAFGSHGDPVNTVQTGTPRNHPVSPELARSVQTGDPRLLLILEQKAWTQAMRPYHLHGLRVANSDRLLLWDGVPMYPGSRDLSHESLGRRRLIQADPYVAYRTMAGTGTNHAHGFEPFDAEHWSSDLVFDHYTITGDAWAKDEMRQLGESLRGLMRPSGYYTSSMQSPRTEGWVMQGLVQAYVATGDNRYRSFAIDRARDIVERDRVRGHSSGALFFEREDGRTPFPTPHRYIAPWQHGAVLYGYLAAWKHFGDPIFLETCERVSACVPYAWVHGFQHPQRGFVPNALRYACPVEHQGAPVAPDAFDGSVGVLFGDHPLLGANSIPAGGLLLLGQVARDASVRQLCSQYGSLLVAAATEDQARWDKWFAVLPDPWGQ